MSVHVSVSFCLLILQLHRKCPVASRMESSVRKHTVFSHWKSQYLFVCDSQMALITTIETASRIVWFISQCEKQKNTVSVSNFLLSVVTIKSFLQTTTHPSRHQHDYHTNYGKSVIIGEVTLNHVNVSCYSSKLFCKHENILVGGRVGWIRVYSTLHSIERIDGF